MLTEQLQQNDFKGLSFGTGSIPSTSAQVAFTSIASVMSCKVLKVAGVWRCLKPRGSMYTTITDLSSKDHPDNALGGPYLIIVVYV